MAGENPLPPEQLAAVVRTLEVFVRRRGSQTSAAKDLGITQGHISSILTKSRGVGVATIVALARALGQTTDQVLGLDEEPSDPALRDALAAEVWPRWVREAALSRRNLSGPLTMTVDEWRGWMRGQMAADTISSAIDEAEARRIARSATSRKLSAGRGRVAVFCG